MTIDERIYQLLVPFPLSQLYPIQAPDGTTTPYTTYLVMNSQNLTTHSAPLPSTRMWRFQFTSYSPTYGVARVTGSGIEQQLVGYTDAFILGITPISSKGSYDDISKIFGWMTELLVTETLG